MSKKLLPMAILAAVIFFGLNSTCQAQYYSGTTPNSAAQLFAQNQQRVYAANQQYLQQAQHQLQALQAMQQYQMQMELMRRAQQWQLMQMQQQWQYNNNMNYNPFR